MNAVETLKTKIFLNKDDIALIEECRKDKAYQIIRLVNGDKKYAGKCLTQDYIKWRGIEL